MGEATGEVHAYNEHGDRLNIWGVQHQQADGSSDEVKFWSELCNAAEMMHLLRVQGWAQ